MSTPILNALRYRHAALVLDDVEYVRILRDISNIPGVLVVYPGGSRYTYPEGGWNDTDVLAFVDGDFHGLSAAGFHCHESDEYGHGRSWSRDDGVNVIALHSVEAFVNRAAAAELCKLHKVASKENRALLHEMIRSPEVCDDRD